ncbi:MAG TPA: alanine racemase [Candidatus Paceibacterota bacterium]
MIERNHKNVRTWIELNRKALMDNYRAIRAAIPPKTKFMAVVKSNAYGHGLTQIAQLLTSDQPATLSRSDVAGSLVASNYLWFGVDSIIEALHLRHEKFKNQILVLGMTLPGRIKEAAQENIILTVSSLPALMSIAKSKLRPAFHLKIDTGMHRQGFSTEELPRVIKVLKKYKLTPTGIYTHFAFATDQFSPHYTLEQLKNFKEAIKILRQAGYKNLLKHSAASGGTLLFPESHMDMVRVGMALYGYYPSLEAARQIGKKIVLSPILSWKSLVGEVKEIPSGAYVGYDLTEKVSRKTKLAVIPIGYWHGFDRGLSSVGEVLIGGLRRRIIGRVSMDMIVVDVTDGKEEVRAGDTVTVIGRDGRGKIWADEMAQKIGTSHYEVLTCINPLIYRKVV